MYTLYSYKSFRYIIWKGDIGLEVSLWKPWKESREIKKTERRETSFCFSLKPFFLNATNNGGDKIHVPSVWHVCRT